MTTMNIEALDTLTARIAQSRAVLHAVSSALLARDDALSKALAAQCWAAETLLEQAEQAAEEIGCGQ